jgi:hypothetical protein
VAIAAISHQASIFISASGMCVGIHFTHANKNVSQFTIGFGPSFNTLGLISRKLELFGVLIWVTTICNSTHSLQWTRRQVSN